MKITFAYDHDKDVWCTLTRGAKSSLSNNSTKTYQEIVAIYGENPTESQVSEYCTKYISEKMSLDAVLRGYQHDWDSISAEYQNIAEKIFRVAIPKTITAFATVNNRCPFNIEENYFFVCLRNDSARKTVMHELWHFYTWYAFGVDQEQKIGFEKYNNIKEVLTVLLNRVCAHLLPPGVIDAGYVQHEHIRKDVLRLWDETQDIDKVWQHCVRVM